jgi:coenzyme F420-0:L-glutamate ligase/coenzyme F420-1:gamma-L-glutamate ligase
MEPSTTKVPVTSALHIYPVAGIPLVREGDGLADLIYSAISSSGLKIEDGNVLVVAQKIVSKAEGRTVRLTEVEASDEARELAQEVDKDPRMVELILRESEAVVRKAPGVVIVRHRLGIVGANAGIDQSNVDHREGECALLLPKDPDLSANRLRDKLMALTGKQLGVIISDSINRPWRLGTVGIAIGSAGITVLDDRRGHSDMFGRELQVTMSNSADSIATAAMLVMGETTERVPVAVVQGLSLTGGSQRASDSIRPPEQDLFL